MHDAAMRRRIAALVIAALLAISAAALTTAYFAANDQVGKDIRGTFAPDEGATPNTGNFQFDSAIRGGNDNDQAFNARDGDNRDT